MADNNEWTVETVHYNKVEQYNRIKMGKKIRTRTRTRKLGGGDL